MIAAFKDVGAAHFLSRPREQVLAAGHLSRYHVDDEEVASESRGVSTSAVSSASKNELSAARTSLGSRVGAFAEIGMVFA
jgi:hypothetical protein